MKYEHNPALPWRNPENVPLSQIPEGWRLMLPGDEGWPTNRCRFWLTDDFSTGENYAAKHPELCCIIPASVPLPEEFRGEPQAIPSAEPPKHAAPSELRDWFAGQALMGVEATWEGDWQNETWCTEAAQHCYQMADAMLKAREAKP